LPAEQRLAGLDPLNAPAIGRDRLDGLARFGNKGGGRRGDGA
jgi:hypothetical protein